MKKYLSKIVISILIFGIFFSPLSQQPEVSKRSDNLPVPSFLQLNKAHAQSGQGVWHAVTVGDLFISNGGKSGYWRTKDASGTWKATKGEGGLGSATWKVTEVDATGSSGTWRSDDDKNEGTWEYKAGTANKVVGSTGIWIVTGDAIDSEGGGGDTVPEIEFGCYVFNFASKSCIAAFFADIIFPLSAIVARFTARILDFFVYYSTESASYGNEFIQKGWQTVRDIANMFFIVALLYVALRTILGMHVADNKKMVGMIILVALLMNFSLFTTKIVIDGSNILAKIFYNSMTSVGPDGEAVESGGQKSISLGIIEKYNPQRLITQKTYDENPYTFIFMTLIVIAIVLYTAYTFISIGFLFVGRVVSLWIDMIFSPLAFASYAVPFKLPGFGHDEWWGKLFKSAFMAPLFTFFLYIIILFTDFLANIISYTPDPGQSGSANDLQQAMTVVVPFALIYGLLSQAKKLTEEYSDEVGKGVVKAGQTMAGVIGGLAVGGGALAVGAIGRRTVGDTVKYVRNDNARSKAVKVVDRLKDSWKLKNEDGKVTIASALKGVAAGPTKSLAALRNFATAGTAQILHKLPGGGGKKIGEHMQELDKGFGERSHALHVIENKTHSEFNKDTKFGDLAEDEQIRVMKEIDKDQLAKKRHGTVFDKVESDSNRLDIRNTVNDAYDNYKTNLGIMSEKSAQATLKSELGLGGHDDHASVDFIRLSKLNQVLGELVQTLRKSTYDPRRLPEISSKAGGFPTKFTVGLIGVVAAGMRLGIKKGVGIPSYGTPQANVFKDITNTIQDAFKNANFNIDLGGGGHGGGHKSSGGGHGGGGHGHH